MGYCILNKSRITINTSTYSATTRSNSIDLGAINTVRYLDTSGVPNANSETYNATTRSSSLDMGKTNNYRYVNTNSVPNSNSTTFTPTSNNSAHDMGATNNYRYVNTNTVYDLGASNVISSATINQNWTIERSQDVSAGKGTQTWSKSLAAGNYIAALAGSMNRPDACYMNLSITGSNLSNVTQLSRITQAYVDAWKTCGLTTYKFRVTATSTIRFACSNSDNTDYAICLSIIKIS